jgi:hypothetical protein
MNAKWHARKSPTALEYSFAPLGLVDLAFSPRLAPWAAFFRRFAAAWKGATHEY